MHRIRGKAWTGWRCWYLIQSEFRFSPDQAESFRRCKPPFPADQAATNAVPYAEHSGSQAAIDSCDPPLLNDMVQNSRDRGVERLSTFRAKIQLLHRLFKNGAARAHGLAIDSQVPSEQLDIAVRGDRAPRPLARRILDCVFGYDYFISYAWADGWDYASELARQLEALRYQVFLDRKGYASGDDWKAVGAWTLRRTGQLILVATPAALTSAPVEREVQLFSITRRRIVPVDINGVLEAAAIDMPLLRYLPSELLRINETADRISSGPSPEALASINRSFDLVRQDTKRLRWFGAIAALLAVLALAAVGLAIWASHNANVATLRRDEALRNQSLFLADQAQKQIGLGNAGTAIWLAASALPKGDIACPTDRPYVPEAELALNASIHGLREELVLAHDPPPAAEKAGGMAGIGSTARVFHAEFDPQGENIITAADNGAIRWWSASNRTFSVLQALEPPHFFFHAVFSRDGKTLAGAGTDGSLWLWDTATKRPLRESPYKEHTDIVQHVVFSPSGLQVATASSDNTARLWDATGVRPVSICTFAGHRDAIYRLTFSRAGNRIVTASRDGVSRIWDIETCNSSELKGHGEGAVFQAEFSPDDQLIVTASEDGTARIWRASDGEFFAKAGRSYRRRFACGVRQHRTTPHHGVA